MQKAANPLDQYQCGPLPIADHEGYDRRLVFDHIVSEVQASPRERFEALAWSVRDVLSQRWLLTDRTYDQKNPKQVYYLSMEFLIGRTLANTISNLRVEDYVRDDLASGEDRDWHDLAEEEPDAGLGNGGLGRLAACFIDSMATLGDPGHRLRTPLRIRHVPPGDRQGLAGRAPG